MSSLIKRLELKCDFNDAQDSSVVSGFYGKFIIFYSSGKKYFSCFCCHFSGCPFMGARRTENIRKGLLYSNCLTSCTANYATMATNRLILPESYEFYV